MAELPDRATIKGFAASVGVTVESWQLAWWKKITAAPSPTENGEKL